MSSIRGVIRDIIIIYICIWIFQIWALHKTIPSSLGLWVLGLFIITVIFFLERLGIIRRMF